MLQMDLNPNPYTRNIDLRVGLALRCETKGTALRGLGSRVVGL